MRKLLVSLVALLLFTGALLAQRTISGKVVDEKGNPISNASVIIKGKSGRGTVTNSEGSYTITVPADAKELIFSSVGHATLEAAISGDVVNATLKLSTGDLAEVVVTAFGIQKTEKALGYAVSKVDPTALLQKSEPDVLKNLAGKVPGVDIRSSQGAPGAASRIQIRGVSSFSGGEPLIVVDGIPYSNNYSTTTNPFSAGGTYGSGFANLDANDIESVNILKGAAAASLYGSRASNGVVVITTKSGNPKKGAKSLNISYKGGFSFEKIADIPDFQNDYGAGANFRTQSSNGSWGAKFGRGVIYDASGNVIGTSASGVDSIPATTWVTMYNAYPELFPNGRAPYKAVPDNVAKLLNTGNLFENSISLNGGEGNTLFSATLSRIDQKGYITNSSYYKNNISVGGQTVVGKLTLGANVSYARSKQLGGYTGAAQAFVSQWGRTFTMARNWDIAGYPSTDRAGNQIGFNDGQYTNPIWGAYHNVITSIDDRVTGTVRASYRINKWARIDYRAGINSYSLFRDQLIDRSSYGGTDNPVGNITEVVSRTQEIQSTLIGIFTPRINEDFTLDIKVGNDLNQRNSRSQTMYGANLVIPGLYTLNNTSVQRFSGDNKGRRRIVGFFGDVSLGYRNFAFLNLTGRTDLTSTLPYKNAVYFYPGISGSLVWTDAFKLNSSWLNYGKVRVGYAKVGKDADANQMATFGFSAVGFRGLSTASRGGTSYDPNMTPEFTTELEIGTDIRMFNSRVSAELTWYDKKSTDLIYAIALPTSTGYTSYYTNLGEISNKGWEAGLTVRPILSSNFSWDIRGVFTKNKNMVVSLVEGLTRDIIGGYNYIEAGMPYGYLRGSVSARAPDGQLLINTVSGIPFVDPNPQMVGDPNAKFKLGITNSLTYKNFNLSILWDMTKGGSFYSESISSMLGRGVTQDTKDREVSRVVQGIYGDPTQVVGADGLPHYVPLLVNGKPVANQTRITTNDLYFSNGTGASFATNGAFEYAVFDGTVYRLRELVLSYSLPGAFVKKIGVAGVTFSLSGRNLWFLAPNVPKYTHFDPDVNQMVGAGVQGVETGSAPSTKRYGFNINVNF